MKPDWLSILEAQLASAPRGGNVFALSTVCDGVPKVRNVVHRSTTPSALLLATTDIRSAKASQLATNPAAEAAWWFPNTNVQLRISGKAFVLPATAEEHERSASRSRRSSSVHSISAVSGVSAATLSAPGLSQESVTATTTIITPPPTTDDPVHAAALALNTTAIFDDKDLPHTPLSPMSHVPAQRSPLCRESSASTDASRHSSSSTTSASASASGSLSRTPSISHSHSHAASVSRTPSLLGRTPSQRTNRKARTQPALEESLSSIRAIVPSTAPESSPSWWTAERKRLWEGMNPAMRASFARSKAPGTKLDFEDEGETWPKTLGKHAVDDDESRTLAFALSNFALLAIAPERVEVLDLAADPHQRTIWVRGSTPGAQWEKEGIAP